MLIHVRKKNNKKFGVSEAIYFISNIYDNTYNTYTFIALSYFKYPNEKDIYNLYAC